MKIATNKFVSVAYELKTGDGDERELKERATAEHPLEFIFGTGSMLPAFEAQLKGLTVNDEFQFTLSPENGHGEFEDEKVVELPKKIFEIDGEFDAEFVLEGNVLPMTNSDGHRMNGTVMAVNEDTVVMNFNHPLAGMTLHFAGTVLEVRKATEDDIDKLYGSSCGCGCGDDCQDSCGCGCGCGCS
ncbi:MAG: FKBP-type peptidyl-prolyl cis-trans isomerase [Tannerella sp.]|jgi:FKBP-type peptidyl-prolyl cis-trans isomerase SlyD|nr:FKBP-type peptidyl-prolyl cis-trans isomerase [Tannerella sp.]